MKRPRYFGWCFITIFLLSACWLKAENMDAGLFSGKPCKPPCWQNLTPGVSTTDDVERFLKNLDQKKWPGRIDDVDNSGCRWLRIADKLGIEVNTLFDLYLNNGKLTFIGSRPPVVIRLKEIVDRFGTPEYFKAVLAVGPDGQYYILEVYYPSQGLAFLLNPNQDKDVGYIKPGMLVDYIEYFPPGDLLPYLMTKYSCIGDQEYISSYAQDIIGKYIQPWSGFGKVNVIKSR